jgi:hypothetical protein
MSLFNRLAAFWAALLCAPRPTLPCLTDAEEMSVLSSLLYCSGN